jgi:uncharacterized protein
MMIIDARVRLRTSILLKMWDTQTHPELKDYIVKYNMQDRLSIMDVGDLLNEALQVGVEKVLVYGSTSEENTHVLELAAKHQSIIPVGGINLERGIRKALEEIIRLKSQKVAAIDFSFLLTKNVNAREYYPLYAYCELNQIPVIIHSAIHYSRDVSMWKAQPQYFDEVAVDFPELTIIMSHGGNGFGPATLAVAQRHPNIFLEFSALRPKYMAPEFIQAANTYLKDRCIFGTDYPLTNFEQQIEHWKYALREEVWDLFFHQNITKALFEEPVSR